MTLLPETARVGLVGKIIDAVAPEVEADPLAVAGSFLTAFGNAVGSRNGPRIRIGPVMHRPNIFVVTVGDSAEGRKGEAYAVTERIFEYAAPEWMERCLLGGFASGEALIGSLAESTDRRRLVVEREHASVLARAGREGSILSAVLRQGFDGSPLENRRVSGAVVATGHHISVIGMITPGELRDSLTGIQAANGYGSRHLFLHVSRQQTLPFGGNMPEDMWRALGGNVADAISEASSVGEMGWADDEAREAWRFFYEKPIRGAGLVRDLSARRDAITLRLAMIFTLCDGANRIGFDHVMAARGMWTAAERSLSAIWGTGDHLADRLSELLHERDEDGNAVYADAGMTLTEQREALGHNWEADRLRSVGDLLEGFGLARREKRPTEGRPADVLLPLFPLSPIPPTPGPGGGVPGEKGGKPPKSPPVDTTEGETGEKREISQELALIEEGR